MPLGRGPPLPLVLARPRAVHRQLPERRHPSPAADAGARLEAGKRRARSASPPTRRRADHAVDAALALPVVRPRDRLVREHPARQLAVAARRAARPARRRSRRAIRWSRSRPPCCSRWSAGASAPQPVAAALVRASAPCWSPRPASTATRPLLPDNLTLPLLWAGARRRGAAAGSVPLRRRRSGARSSATSRSGRCYWLFQLTDRQGRHGLRRLQAARRPRRLAGLADDPADRPRLLSVSRRRRRHRPDSCSQPRPRRAATSRSVPSSPAPGWSSCSSGRARAAAGCAGPERRGARVRSRSHDACASASPAASAAARARSRRRLVEPRRRR